ncbi:MAG: amino acid racemase [Sulfuricella sp.]|nr:amino acid racemase [Sulfuricella sp.]
MLGILGGMGPAATADFFTKLVALTPAQCDQEHIPLLISCLPQTPDRTAAILGHGPSCLPALLAGLRRLTDGGAQAIAIPCNASHHWHAQLQAAVAAPILHIADAAIAALPPGDGTVMLMATRGTLASGFYQRKLSALGRRWQVPAADEQPAVDEVIAAIKRADLAGASAALQGLWTAFAGASIDAAVMACTEIPLAAQHLPAPPFAAIDTNLELARAAVTHAIAQGWNRTC